MTAKSGVTGSPDYSVHSQSVYVHSKVQLYRVPYGTERLGYRYLTISRVPPNNLIPILHQVQDMHMHNRIMRSLPCIEKGAIMHSKKSWRHAARI